MPFGSTPNQPVIEDTVRDTSDGHCSGAARILGHLHPSLADDDSDRAATSALIWLNALLFQELLAAKALAQCSHQSIAAKSGSPRLSRSWTCTRRRSGASGASILGY